MHEIKIVFLKLILSLLLGGLIGLERDIRGRHAGLRTHILVCLGSCLFMLISIDIFSIYHSYNSNSILRIDPARIAAQIITGIGFIGAGTILRSGTTIIGLTTAGSIWVCAGIGMALGLGYFIPAFLTTAITLLSLLILNKVELIFPRTTYFQIHMTTINKDNIEAKFLNFLEKENLKVRDFELKNIRRNNILHINFTLVMKRTGIKRHYFSKTVYKKIIDEFKNYIIEISWKKI